MKTKPNQKRKESHNSYNINAVYDLATILLLRIQRFSFIDYHFDTPQS